MRERTQRVGIYLRISEDRDGGQKATQRQRQDCEAWVARNGGVVAGVYEDVDASAFSGRVRPQFARLLGDVRDGALDGVLAWKIDRIARRMTDFVALDEACRASGAWIATIADGIDTRNPMGRTAAEIFVAMARMESENTSLRQKRKQQELRDAGKHRGGNRIFGLTKDKRALIPEEVAITQEVVGRLLAGESLYQLVRNLDARGIRTARGKVWQRGRLKAYLLTPSIVGSIAHEGVVVRRNAWPAVITEEQQQQLASLLGRHAVYPRRGNYLLSGLMKCGRCGNTMTGWSPGGRTKYRCFTASIGREGCGASRLAYGPDEEVTARVMYRLSRATGEALQGDDGAGAALRESIIEDEAWMEKLSRDYYVDRSIDAHEYQAARSALAQRLEQSRQALARTMQRNATQGLAGAPLAVLGRYWVNATLDVRRSIIAAVCEEIRLQPAGKGVRWQPEQIVIRYRF